MNASCNYSNKIQDNFSCRLRLINMPKKQVPHLLFFIDAVFMSYDAERVNIKYNYVFVVRAKRSIYMSFPSPPFTG